MEQLSALSREQFERAILGAIESEFPNSALAYGEISGEVTQNLFEGKASKYLDAAPSLAGNSSKGAELEFGPVELAAFAASITPALDLAKLAAETFLAIKKCVEKSGKHQVTREAAEEEIAISLVSYVGEAKARALSKEIGKRIWNP